MDNGQVSMFPRQKEPPHNEMAPLHTYIIIINHFAAAA